jgi:transposase
LIPPSVQILVCTEAQDMRRSFDGLARVARETMELDPRSGKLLCFVNKRGNRVKVLWWDKTGYCILYKRMHEVIARIPLHDGSAKAIVIDGRKLAMILAGVARPRSTRCKRA